jgi:hypothetical protein
MHSFHAWFDALAPFAMVFGWYTAWEVSRRHLRRTRELRDARMELKAADDVGVGLCREIAGLREHLEGAHAEIEVLGRNNYELACIVHGKAAVDKAIADARERGTN